MDNQTTEQPQDLSTNPQEISTVEQQTPEVQQEVSGEAATGEIVEKKTNSVGRPSGYNETMLQIASNYYKECLEPIIYTDKNGNQRKSYKYPKIEELARISNKDDETIMIWAKEKIDPEYSATIKRIQVLQKERTIDRGFSMSNPTFAIFMLKANHGMIETEKRILAGERNGEPVQVTVNEYTPGQKAVPSGIAVDQLSE